MTREAGALLRSGILGAVIGLVVLAIAAVAVLLFVPNGHGGPSDGDYVFVDRMSERPDPSVVSGPGASTGSVTSACGRNEIDHTNTDNFVAAPGQPGGAHHTHEYVGNVSTDAMSTEASLAAAATTCSNGDLSSYFWPVLRLLDGQTPHGFLSHGLLGGTTGVIQRPESVSVRYLGNPLSDVVPMPRFLRLGVGDPRAFTDGGGTRAQWGCTRIANRATSYYPLCPDGDVTRTFEFPSCWNGLDTDSPSHTSHVRFPFPNGACAQGTFPIPKLRIVLAYRLPPGPSFAVDSFPDQQRNPTTDHGFLVNVMPEELMVKAARCINEGLAC